MVSRTVPVQRWLRHLCTGRLARQRCFPSSTLDAIESAVRELESQHPGEIRVAIEASLSPAQLWRGVTPRDAAIATFAQLGVWDTEHNNGVLIYVLLADHDVEIVADRGVGEGRVPQQEWQAACDVMRAHFREGQFEQGVVTGIHAVADVLARYPPDRPDVGNELPNAPVVF